MPKMTNATLQAILAAERADALASISQSDLTDERDRALRYYKGDMEADMPSIAGRSSAVSTDVADTIEGLMPSLMEIFCATEDVVEFDPVGIEDEDAAQQESDYVNHVFMQKNPGFMVLYSMIKDALLSKVGVVKVWWEENEAEEKETYFNLDDDALAILASDPEVQIIEHTEHGLYDDGDEPAPVMPTDEQMAEDLGVPT